LGDLGRTSILDSPRVNRDEAYMARETPNVANQVQYPKEFYNTVPVITALPLKKQKITTIIIATKSRGYTEESFNTDVRKTAEYFGLDPTMYEAILLLPSREDLKVLDSADAVDKLRRVVDKMNSDTVLHDNLQQRSETEQLSTGDIRHVRKSEEVIITTASAYAVRIVSLGVATSNFIFEALEFMVNHWRVPHKAIQFITNGEIEDDKFLKFWTSACINDLVRLVQFVNLKKYLSFGYYDGSCKKLNKTCPWNADERALPNQADKPSIAY